jgi:hypothetical protein
MQGVGFKSSPFLLDVSTSRVSFYTFHGLSYVIDICITIKAEYNLLITLCLCLIFRYWLRDQLANHSLIASS